jgi:DNA polymerase I-like protein with 3'-5' exonuclease and polymerase domains
VLIGWLQDVFGMERRRAKVLNFSIAYGKTAHGLAKDWNTSLEEAQHTLELWYSDRPEVREWQVNSARERSCRCMSHLSKLVQQRTIEMARKTGYTRTLMGRYRPLPHINSPKYSSARVRSSVFASINLSLSMICGLPAHTEQRGTKTAFRKGGHQHAAAGWRR